MHETGVGFFVGAGVPRGPRVNTFIECGCCGAYHRTDFNGDCREDSERHWDLPDDAVVLCHCGYGLEDGECPSADCRDDDDALTPEDWRVALDCEPLDSPNRPAVERGLREAEQREKDHKHDQN